MTKRKKVKPRSRLQWAAICALADLVELHLEGGLAHSARSTLTELYEGLQEEGVDVSGYQEEYRAVKNEGDE